MGGGVERQEGGEMVGIKVGRVVLEVEFEERRWRWKRVCGDGA